MTCNAEVDFQNLLSLTHMVVFRHHTRDFYFLPYPLEGPKLLVLGLAEFCFKDFVLTETKTFFPRQVFQNSQKASKGSTKKNLFF